MTTLPTTERVKYLHALLLLHEHAADVDDHTRILPRHIYPSVLITTRLSIPDSYKRYLHHQHICKDA